MRKAQAGGEGLVEVVLGGGWRDFFPKEKQDSGLKARIVGWKVFRCGW